MAERPNKDTGKATAETGKDSQGHFWNSLRTKRGALGALAAVGALSFYAFVLPEQGGESGDDSEGTVDPTTVATTVATTEKAPEEATQDGATMEQTNRNAWFATWGAEDNRHPTYHSMVISPGEVHEVLFDETPENIKGFVDDFIGILERVADSESEEDLDRGSLVGGAAETHYLKGTSLLLQNEDGIFQVKNPIIRGIIFPSDEAQRSIERGEDPESFFAVGSVDLRKASQFMLFYPDQNGDWQTFSWHAGNLSAFSDESTDIVGAFMEEGYEEPEVVQGIFDWENLQSGLDNVDSIVINDEPEGVRRTVHEPGQEATVDEGEVSQTSITLSPQTFDSMEDAWEYHQAKGVYRPVTVSDFLSKADDSALANRPRL